MQFLWTGAGNLAFLPLFQFGLSFSSFKFKVYFLSFQICVKNKALQSVMLVRNVTKEEGMKAVNEVFDKCYNDNEPYGRRCFKDLNRANRALNRARIYYDFD